MIKRVFMQEGSERRRHRMKLEHTYDMVTRNESSEIKTVQLKKLKAKITRFHTKENKQFFLDNNHIDVVEGEDPSIFHIIRAQKGSTCV
jgi:hypothetical protein